MGKKPQIGITVKKSENFSEWFTQLMQKAKLADIRYNVKGFPVYMPWAVKSIKKITRLWEDELERNGHEPLMMPLLIPEGNFHRESEHVEGFTPSVFWVTHAGDKKLEEKYALRPTSETALYDMYGKWIQSYNDLPLKRYQTASVYRYETKMTRPFMRTRELYWTEAHDVFASEKEAFAQVKEDMEVTHKLLYGEMALPHIFFERPQWDKFPGAANTFAADVLLPSGKVLQLPSTHMISQNFSKAFGVKFVDKDEKEKDGWITCYGPCHSRNYGALITFHGDDTGLILPWNIAPLEVIVVPILIKGKEKSVLVKCNKIVKSLLKEGYTVKLDDSDNTPGWKFNQWEMKGVPVRVEIGPKDVSKKAVTVYRRDISVKKQVLDGKLLSYVKSVRKTFTKNLQDKADKLITGKMKKSSTMKEIKKLIAAGNMVRTCFCSTEMAGAKCAETVEKELGAEVRGTWFGKKEKVFSKCPVCGKKGTAVVYIAKSH